MNISHHYKEWHNVGENIIQATHALLFLLSLTSYSSCHAWAFGCLYGLRCVFVCHAVYIVFGVCVSRTLVNLLLSVLCLKPLGTCHYSIQLDLHPVTSSLPSILQSFLFYMFYTCIFQFECVLMWHDHLKICCEYSIFNCGIYGSS